MIQPLQTSAQRLEAGDLIARCLELKPGLGGAFRGLFENLLDHGGVEPEDVHIAVEQDRVIGHTLVLRRSFLVHGQDVPGAQIGMVVVHPDARGRGVGRELLASAEAHAAACGCVVAHLSGDPGYYVPAGYIPAYTLSAARLPDGPIGEAGRLRPASPTDIPLLVDLARRAAPIGAVCPDAARWNLLFATGHPAGLLSHSDAHFGFRAERDHLLVLDANRGGRAFARMAVGAGRAAVYESATDKPGASQDPARVLLAAIRAWLAEASIDKCDLLLPPDDPLLAAAAAEDAAVQTGEDPERLARLLNASALLRAVRPVLEARARTTTSGSLLIRCDGRPALHLADGSLTLAPDPGRNAEWCVDLPPAGLLRAVFGTDRLADRLSARPNAHPALHALADGLFPAGNPAFWLADSI